MLTTQHVSHVTLPYHVSCVMCHVSHDICHALTKSWTQLRSSSPSPPPLRFDLREMKHSCSRISLTTRKVNRTMIVFVANIVISFSMVPPLSLDSETGWTGELWSKTIISSNSKTKKIALFLAKKNQNFFSSYYFFYLTYFCFVLDLL